MKKIYKIFSRPVTLLIPTGLAFALSIMLYSCATDFIYENKLNAWWELIIVMGSVLLLTIAGIIFLGVVSVLIVGGFRRIFACFRRVFSVKKPEGYRTPGVNFRLID
ncbi:MAG: hypothetical protein FWG83_06610 [Oscillospiraceae bacterium]|nr:hypothetical protein [Oscillospiraceae bacterium]